jgi:hypothetical protein
LDCCFTFARRIGQASSRQEFLEKTSGTYRMTISQNDLSVPFRELFPHPLQRFLGGFESDGIIKLPRTKNGAPLWHKLHFNLKLYVLAIANAVDCGQTLFFYGGDVGFICLNYEDVRSN